jgi:hypothetical protein
MSPDALDERVLALRRAFDDGFAKAAAPAARDPISLLVVRAGGLPQAVAISDLAGVVSCPALVPLPRQHASFLGLGAVAGRPMAAYALDALLGLARGDAPRWLLILPTQVAIGVSAIIGHLQARPEDVRRDRALHVHPTVSVGETTYPLLDLPALSRPIVAAAPPRPPTSTE